MAYSYYKPLTIDYTKCGTANSTDFPMLVLDTDAALKTTGNGGRVTNANGYDIAYYSDSGLTTQLKHEVESYNASTGAVVHWVKIPTLSASANTVIYRAYADSGISTSQADPTNVWSNNFRAVYHLPDGSTLSANDSTGNYNATVTGATANSALINGCASFGGGTNTHRIVSADMTSSASQTWSFWIYANGIDSTSRRVFAITNSSDFRSQVLLDTTNSTEFQVKWSGSTARWRISNPSTGSWYHVAIVYNGSSTSNDPLVYANTNSASVTEIAAPSGSILTSTAMPLYIGNRYGNDRCFNGYIDEVRFATTTRSLSWIIAEYNNQNDPSTFYSVDSEVAVNTTRRRISIS